MLSTQKNKITRYCSLWTIIIKLIMTQLTIDSNNDSKLYTTKTNHNLMLVQAIGLPNVNKYNETESNIDIAYIYIYFNVLF